MIQLDTPLGDVHGIGTRFLTNLKRLRIHTVRDLLWFFPSRYEDYSIIYQITDLVPGQHATIQGTVHEIESRRTWQKRMAVVEAVIQDETGDIRAVWFNQPYLTSTLHEGDFINIAGKVAQDDDDSLYFSHPTFEKVRSAGTSLPHHKKAATHTARLVPVYPETRGLTSKGIRAFVQSFLRYAEVPEWIPETICRNENLPSAQKALRDIHFPSRIEDAEAARRRFSFEDLFLLQLANLIQKQALAEERAPRIPTDIEWLKSALRGLPYELTETQKRSLWEIVKNINEPHPMNRLLQGDVGSGKTVVAALTALIAARAGYQTAFMAPTEVLARQHYETLIALFKNIQKEFQPVLCLLTAGAVKLFYENDLETQPKKSNLIEAIQRGEVGIVIGTHALIQKSLSFHSLGLVIVDEQHRFGVRQRQALLRGQQRKPAGQRQKPQSAHVPHFLSMSATPIPRTLMMTVFGDLDISTITELPKGRQTITTTVVPANERKGAYDLMRQKIKEGRQAFVICPRIEKPEENGSDRESRGHGWDEVKAVQEEYKKLSTYVFPDLRIGMLHGKMPVKPKRSSREKSKAEVMHAFQKGDIDILVATSVVEVGIDVPNATIMMIEGADRFGLAQLYQLRGRVGRGTNQSYCFLFTDKDNAGTTARLRAIVGAKNGFELAEQDLKLRGPGQFLGEAQTGLPDIAMQGIRDAQLVKASRDAALVLLREDHNLSRHPRTKEKLAEFKKALHLE